MQLLEVSGVVRLIYGSLGVKRLRAGTKPYGYVEKQLNTHGNTIDWRCARSGGAEEAFGQKNKGVAGGYRKLYNGALYRNYWTLNIHTKLYVQVTVNRDKFL